MAKKDYYKKYEKLSNEMFEHLKDDFLPRVNKAREKLIACNKYSVEVVHPRQIALSKQLGGLVSFLNEVQITYDLGNTKERSEIFNEQFDKLESSKREDMLKHLAEKHALELMTDFVHQTFSDNVKINAPNHSEHVLEFVAPAIEPRLLHSVKWLGTNQTEFAQFVYALHEAGYIQHEKKEITSLVKDLAELLNFDLSESWQVNLSDSVHKRKTGYVPKFFDNLKKGYTDYQDRQVNKT